VDAVIKMSNQKRVTTMSIRITGQSPTQYMSINSDSPKLRNTPAPDRGTEVLAGTDTNLSERAKFLSQLASHIASLPIVDEDKVSALKNKIENGKYISDYLTVAETMIKSEQEINYTS
jgi:flagellar biosynthesis anti-sigma factor FlgM